METITINGEEYVKKSDMPIPYESDHLIAIADRGWIFIGQGEWSDDSLTLSGASVVRSWSNGRGIGGLAKPDYKDDYMLDHIGTVSVMREAVIATIPVEW